MLDFEVDREEIEDEITEWAWSMPNQRLQQTMNALELKLNSSKRENVDSLIKRLCGDYTACDFVPSQEPYDVVISRREAMVQKTINGDNRLSAKAKLAISRYLRPGSQAHNGSSLAGVHSLPSSSPIARSNRDQSQGSLRDSSSDSAMRQSICQPIEENLIDWISEVAITTAATTTVTTTTQTTTMTSKAITAPTQVTYSTIPEHQGQQYTAYVNELLDKQRLEFQQILEDERLAFQQVLKNERLAYSTKVQQ